MTPTININFTIVMQIIQKNIQSRILIPGPLDETNIVNEEQQ
jgi:hypothetical protein